MTDEGLKSYLLGNMPQAARAALEERYLSDDETYERLLALEEELIDHQAHGLLSRCQWEALQRHLLLSENTPERLSFARALAQLHLQRRQHSAGRFATVVRQWIAQKPLVPAVCGAMILLVFMILGRNFHFDRVLLDSRNGVSDRTHEAMAESLPPLDHTSSLAATLFLRPTIRGESAGNVLRIPSGYGHVVLEAEFPSDERKAYQASIQGVDGGPIQTAVNIRKAGKQAGIVRISADFAAAPLNEGDYILTIFMQVGDRSSEEVIAYPFSVIRAPPA
jgi:hypothetical protein